MLGVGTPLEVTGGGGAGGLGLPGRLGLEPDPGLLEGLDPELEPDPDLLGGLEPAPDLPVVCLLFEPPPRCEGFCCVPGPVVLGGAGVVLVGVVVVGVAVVGVVVVGVVVVGVVVVGVVDVGVVDVDVVVEAVVVVVVVVPAPVVVVVVVVPVLGSGHETTEVSTVPGIGSEDSGVPGGSWKCSTWPLVSVMVTAQSAAAALGMTVIMDPTITTPTVASATFSFP